jgi:hypothetical protein
MKLTLISIVGLLISAFTYGQTGESTNKTNDQIEYIKKETIGGKLDFNLTLEKESKGLYLYDGVAYNKKDFAIFLWGQAVKRLGITSSKKAAKLWREINTRELTGAEKKALTKGFNTEIK